MTDFMEKETLNDEVKSVIEHTICK
jgi:hypothetical protein